VCGPVTRAGQEITVQVTLTERPAN
jgi:hypothetical protein